MIATCQATTQEEGSQGRLHPGAVELDLARLIRVHALVLIVKLQGLVLDHQAQAGAPPEHHPSRSNHCLESLQQRNAAIIFWQT